MMGELVVGESVMANRGGRIGGGADLCSDMFLSLFFYFGGGFGDGCGLILVVVFFFFFFFSW